MNKEFKSNGINENLAHSKIWKMISCVKLSALNFILLTIFILSTFHTFAQDSIVVKGKFIFKSKILTASLSLIYNETKCWRI